MKAMRRILAVIAAMAMVLSLMPFAVFAADEGADDGSAVVSQEENEGGQEAEEAEASSDEAEPSDDAPEAEEEKPSDDASEAEKEPSDEEAKGEVQVQDGDVAKIGSAGYATLADAVTSANDGDTITLLADASGGGIFIGENKFTSTGLTIDFGGHTYTVTTPVGSTGTVNQALHFEQGNKITLQNGTIKVTSDATELSSFEMFMQNYGALTIENMTLDGTGIAVAHYGSNFTGAWAVFNNTEKPQFNYNTAGASVIRNSTITMLGALGIDDNAAVTFEDDAVINVSAIATKGTDNRYASASPAVTVENGAKFKLTDSNNATAFATLLAANGQSLGTPVNGVYTVAATKAAQVGDIQYDTLAAAVAEANGNTVKLLRNVALSQGVDISGTVTLDLNGKTISDASGLSDDYLLAVLHGGTLTVQDSGSGGMVSMSKEYCAIKMTKANGDSTKNATLIVDSGIIEGKDFAISGNGNAGRGNSYITINGGTIRNTKSTGSGDDAAIYQPNTGTVTLNGGTITGLTGVEIRSGDLVIPANSTVTVTGTGNPATYNGNSNGTTTFGAGIAVAQHTTDNSINVDIKGGTISGAYALAVVNPNNRTVTNVTVAVSGGTFQGDLQVTDTRVTKFISGGTFSTAPDENFVADGCDALQGSGSWSVVPSLHNFDYTKPDVRWRVINADNDVSAKMVAIFIYHCTHCDETETVVVTPTYDDTSNSGKRTYTATDTEHGKTAELVTTTSYTVTLDGTNNGTYEWGQICSLPSPGGAKAWYVDSISPDNMVADGISSYVFAVTDTATTSAGTGTVAIVTGDPSSSDHQTPVIRPHLTATGSGTAVFNAKWSIPKGASVDSVTIYRGHTTADTTVSAATLKAKGEQHNVYLKVWNGDYTLNLSGLTTGTYQHVMIEIVYTDSSGNSHTETSAVKAVQVT